MTDFVSDCIDLPNCIDLHVHSTLSDGAFAPSEVVALLAGAGISVACFTDHNCVHPHYAALQDHARWRHDVLLPFPGAEVTAVYNDPAGRDRAYVLHVLAYGTVLEGGDANVRSSRLAICNLTHKVLSKALWMLGVDAPERM